MDRPAPIAPHYHMPADTKGTVFDPFDDTFGPIMAALQAGDFERAARLTGRLAYQAEWETVRPEVKL